MIELKVAWGFTNSENARSLDPNAELDLKQFDGKPMYKTYSLKNEDMLKGFLLGIEEMDCNLTAYTVKK